MLAIVIIWSEVKTHYCLPMKPLSLTIAPYYLCLLENKTIKMKNTKQNKMLLYQRIKSIENTKIPAKLKKKKSATFFDRRHLFWKLVNLRVEILILNTFRYSRFHLTQHFMVLLQQHIFCTNPNKQIIIKYVYLRIGILMSSFWNC